MEIIKNIIYSELLSQEIYIRLNKRLIAILSLKIAVFISALINKYNYFYNLYSLIGGRTYIWINI